MALTAGMSFADDSMPRACEPWPGKRKATRVAGTADAGEGSCAAREGVSEEKAREGRKKARKKVHPRVRAAAPVFRRAWRRAARAAPPSPP
jgi:hypothetical protein